MDRFSLDSIKLFNKYPLHQYTTLSDQGERQLRVLLLGKGEKLDTVLYQILCNGQLPNLALYVTVVCGGAGEMADLFIEKTPAAGQFIRVMKDDALVTDPHEPLCSLSFRDETLNRENFPALAAMSKTYSYILVSTGNDALDRELAVACAAATAGNARMIAQVQSDFGKTGGNGSSGLHIYSSTPARSDSYYLETERVAFNLHYVYEKSGDSRKPPEQIEQSFRDPYNYLSSMEAATHVRAKLACCGIRDTDPGDAARALNRLLREDPIVLEQLSAVEHARWLMTKLLQGYRPMPSVDKIYSAPGIGTRDSKAKWHCCLVPCDMTGKSRIEEQDWEASFAKCRRELDPLDRVTLQVHERCKEIAEQNRVGIGQMLQTVTLILNMEEGYSQETRDCNKRLQTAIRQLWAEKKSAVPLFGRELQAFREQIQMDAASPSFVLQSTLEQIEEAVAPLIEYVSRKDYKELDRILVGQLPYVLTRRSNLILAKPISQTLPENLYTVRQFAPQQMIYLAIARSETDVPQLCFCADQIRSFLAKHCEKATPAFHLIAPEALVGAQLRLAQSHGYQLQMAAEFSSESIQRCIESIAGQTAIDAFDVTGADPLLTQAITGWANKTHAGVFYTQKGTFYNLQNAEEFEYERPHAPLTVSEMFDMTGAVCVHNDTKELSELSELSAEYPALLEIARSTPRWDAFCKAIFESHRKKRWHYQFFGTAREGHPDTKILVTGPIVAAASLLPPLRQLKAAGVIRDLSYKRDPLDQCTVCFMLPEKVGDPQHVINYLNRVLKQYQSDMDLRAMKHNGTPELAHTSLLISNFIPENGDCGDFEDLLRQLEERGWIKEHIIDPKGGHTFTLASRELLTCLERGGNVLERLIYFSALLDGNFDDVEIGWTFSHNASDDAAKNEIDIICTKGLRSLFVSAKMASSGPYETNKNYFFYEILLNAQKFGINAIPVFVTSTIGQFVECDGQMVLSRDAEHALSRGVYLIGRECVERNEVGRMLECILAGSYGSWPEEWSEGSAVPAAPERSAKAAESAAPCDCTRGESPKAARSERDAFIEEIFCGEADFPASEEKGKSAAIPDAAAEDASLGAL